MIQKIHSVSIVINGQTLELSDNENLGLRINNLIFDPTKISSEQAEYSFTFKVPITPTNIKIFDWANVLEKNNKFNKLYTATVYGDGHIIFKGQLKISSIDKENFNCNLISIKVNKIEDIFGDSTMNQIQWYVDYNGVSTINSINNNDSTDYFFPLVCYGAFQKVPSTTYVNDINAFSSKYLIDKTNRWYEENFYPSVRMNSLVKRMFEQKGYTVTGNIFDDETANSIFLSTNLADGQDPVYNLGGSRGKIEVSWKWKNKATITTSSGWSRISAGNLFTKNLTHPHQYLPQYNKYNWQTAQVWDIWKSCWDYDYRQYSEGGRTSIKDLKLELNHNNNYLFDNGAIIVPADGLYKITLKVNFDINDATVLSDCLQWKNQYDYTGTNISKNWESMPFEIQIIKNNIDNVELIYGYDGNYLSDYPHEAPPTYNGYGYGNGSYSNNGDSGTSSGQHRTGGGGARGTVGTRGVTDSEGEPVVNAEDYNYGLVQKQGFMLCYDPWVNSDFVCGFTTVNKSASVIKNGYSWNSESYEMINSRYNCGGYYGVEYDGSSYNWKSTTYNGNAYRSAPNDLLTDGSGFTKNGTLSCVVHLKKNDVLMCVGINKVFELTEFNGGFGEFDHRENFYQVNCNGTFTLEAYSPNVSDISSDTLTYYSPSKFDTQLNLGQFMNKETKQSEFITNYMKALNLNFALENNVVTLNKNYIDYSKQFNPVEMDNRVNNEEITISPIDYPSSMRVSYSIDDEEAGFYYSVPSDKVEQEDWKDYADVGSEKVEFINYGDTEDEEVSLGNSYCWYHDFKVNRYDSSGNVSSTITISLPIISKDEWMIDGYKPEESMQHDGYGLKQRWWFRQNPRTDFTLETTNGEEVVITIPTNTSNDITLNYNNEEGTLLKKYFNLTQYISSDMIEFEVYPSTEEYLLMKKGGTVRVNSDIYYITELNGFDPTGQNTTKVKAMRKT